MVMGMRSSGFPCFSSTSSCASAAISSARDAARRWGRRMAVDGQRRRRGATTDTGRGAAAPQHGGATAYAVRAGVERPARAGRTVRALRMYMPMWVVEDECRQSGRQVMSRYAAMTRMTDG